MYYIPILFISCLFFIINTDPSTQLAIKLDNIINSRQLKGLQLEINKNTSSIFYHHTGIKNSNNQPINNNTIFTVASLSKSFSAVAIMQLVEKKLIKLNDSLTKIFGFQIKNPYFPNTQITIEMILSHQSSIGQVDPEFTDFIKATQNSTDGSTVPSIKQILSPGEKYYNPNIYSPNRKPGQYFRYSNLGYAIAGTIVQLISKTRFDIYQKQNILDFISSGLPENATFNPATIKNYKDLATIFVGVDGQWIANRDNYSSPISQKNLTNYKIGTNGAIYGPSDSLRASMHHMNNYIYMLSNNGVTKNGKRILNKESVDDIIRPRYQYHGSGYGNRGVFHLYGLGIFTTSYLIDSVIDHEVVRGHLGEAYGLISGYFYWKDYTLSYIVNGAMNGYEKGSGSIYQIQRILIHDAVNNFILSIQEQQYKQQ